MRTRSLALATAVAAAAACLTGASAGGAPAAGAPAAPFDVNGDGYRDLVIGVPRGTVDGAVHAGYVAVVPGSASGPDTAKRWTVSQATAGVPGVPEVGDAFGDQVTSADLDGNGYADLVVSVGGETGGDDNDVRGRIHVFWYGPSGLTGSTSLPGAAASYSADRAGLHLADVNGDEHLDLVTAESGASEGVALALGPFAPEAEPPRLTRMSPPRPDAAWVTRVAVGDIDGDGLADVAATYYGDNDGAYVEVGVGYLRGTASGLAAAPDWYGEHGAEAVAMGDFDKDGYADVALGATSAGDREDEDADEPYVPRYPLPAPAGGNVRILYGSPQGPAATRAPADIDQQTPGVPGDGTGPSELGDGFGAALSAGDVDGDGYDDLAVSKPHEGIGDTDDAGAVNVLYGSPAGLTGTGSQVFHQDTAGVPDISEAGDHFGGTGGSGLLLEDFSDDGEADLAVSASGEGRDAGRVWSFAGTAAGITAAGSEAFDAVSLGLPGPTRQLYFGAGLRD